MHTLGSLYFLLHASHQNCDLLGRVFTNPKCPSNFTSWLLCSTRVCWPARIYNLPLHANPSLIESLSLCCWSHSSSAKSPLRVCARSSGSGVGVAHCCLMRAGMVTCLEGMMELMTSLALLYCGILEKVSVRKFFFPGR